MSRALAFATGVLGLLSTLVGCKEDLAPVFIARCENDLGCQNGEICIEGECVARDSVSCQAVDGGQPILQPGPSLLEFGQVGSGTSMRPLKLRNIGDCSLTIFEAYFEREERSAFECPSCRDDKFPLEIFPFREQDVKLYFTPNDVGLYEDTLIILSDDAEFPEIRVPVKARFNGVPKLAVIPEEIDFDYSPVGRTIQQTVRMVNLGTGTAPLVLSKLEIESSTTTTFSFEPAIINPIELPPVDVEIASSPAGINNAGFVVNLKYHPREIAQHRGELLVYTNQLSDSVVRVPLSGSSETPAKIRVSPEVIYFGPVPLGQSTSQTITIVNEGGSLLRASYRWGGLGLSTDFSASPAILPPIRPGSYTEMQVLVTATTPGPITGLLLLESNDPNRPSITIPVSADGQAIAGTQVVKVDMNFENGEDSVFDDDLRNVDMSLENPFGLLCNKQTPNPANWGGFGSCSWISFGPKEEPERIVLPDALQDGTYRVLVSYQEDCASIPTNLLASVLGISVEVLIGYLSGGVIGIDNQDIKDAIDDLCLDRESASVTVTVYLNGAIAAEKPVNLSREGDYQYAVDLIRSGGVFTVR